MRKKYSLFLLPLCLWLTVIFTFSSQTYHQQSIQPLLREHFSHESVRDLLPDIRFQYHQSTIDIKKDPIKSIEFFVRKTAHVLLYGILAVLAYLTLLPAEKGVLAKGTLALLTVGVIASLDEWNQARNSFRTGALEDVLLDWIEGCLGLACCLPIWIGQAGHPRDP
ncbi:VanZ family protein [Effusibacillus consociatus]|uniref:VanZ family protein n=1 Tax=Effusibacillus consociatus TaxID=1117041 RepID=A0ABV9Q3F4_9BACL